MRIIKTPIGYKVAPIYWKHGTVTEAMALEKIFLGDCVQIVNGKAKRMGPPGATHVAIDPMEKGGSARVLEFEDNAKEKENKS